MLTTSAREWASLMALCLLLLLLLSRMREGDTASVTWGHVGKYASPLLTEDVYLTPSAPGWDLVYGSQNASDNYRITGIHVEDLNDSGAEAHLTAGGIGQKFVVLRCQRNQSWSTGHPAHLEVAIYGLDLQ
ncbi:uncharacterized protein LOC110178464 [Drosophila serrata]|uniref:uncharacterized protein LOC110178464 n=1 Tax=Drosophila serrata TaxID=7274 RepID=UPI000A1D182B|nr:uncharacterized protein LOC110178464 [Drosophila serrata]